MNLLKLYTFPEARMEGGIPAIPNSTHRATYVTPSFPGDIDCEPTKTTRFGYTPREHTRGIGMSLDLLYNIVAFTFLQLRAPDALLRSET